MKKLQLKKEVVSVLNRDQSSLVKGGIGEPTIIPMTDFCAITQRNCATKDQLGLCVSATTCNTDLCPLTKGNDCLGNSVLMCLQTNDCQTEKP